MALVDCALGALCWTSPAWRHMLPSLPEGTRIVANIVDCPFDEIHVDMPVECSIEEVEPGYKLPLFRRIR